MRSLEQIDSWIAGKVKSWSSKVAGPQQSRELLEVRRDILGEIRDKIEPLGEGRRVFPYDTILIRIAVQTAAQALLFNAALGSQDGIEQDIRELLVRTGCSVPASLSVTVSTVEDPGAAWNGPPVRVEFTKTNVGAKSANKAVIRPTLRFTVVRGESEAPTYTIASDRINIGRLKEVFGDKDGLRRRNDIAFADTQTSVSREHAQIRYEPATGHFRLFDSRSQRGTAIFRAGRRIELPAGSAAGVQLQSGDEIHVGDARIVVGIRAPEEMQVGGNEAAPT